MSDGEKYYSGKTEQKNFKSENCWKNAVQWNIFLNKKFGVKNRGA